MKRQKVNQAIHELLRAGFIVSYNQKRRIFNSTHSSSVDHASIIGIVPQGWSSAIAKITVNSWPDYDPVEVGNIPTAIKIALREVAR